MGSNELAACGLSIMLANMTQEALCWGMLTALDTLGSQAYGAGNYRRVGGWSSPPSYMRMHPRGAHVRVRHRVQLQVSSRSGAWSSCASPSCRCVSHSVVLVACVRAVGEVLPASTARH